MQIIFLDSQKCASPKKIEVSKIARLNSKSFEFNSIGLNQDQVKGRSKNVGIFGGAPENDERINGKVGDQELRQQKHWDFASVLQ